MPQPPQPPRPPHPPVPDHKPLAPALNSIPHNAPPQESKTRSLLFAVVSGSILSLIVGILLAYFKISINVILPVLAPVWVGSITLIYSVNTKN